MYAVELFFEEEFEKYVKNIWKGLKDQNISSNMYDISYLKPHITMAVYSDIPSIESICRRLSTYFDSVIELELKFDVLASFPTTGTLFIDPTVTEDLLKMHKKYHAEFSDLFEFSNPYYIPNNWVPHCTLAIRLSPEQILDAMKYCYKDFVPLRSKVIEVGIVKLEYDSNNVCISSSTIASNKLKVKTNL
ncbi:2'-5' RNA ligase family protein [Paenibacillus gallinarum]|uniref:2'-5' RNA ligase family protein n=1 Tax=Paenibacillus gallinarum TaxID=2762232 RepID=A0ABR8T0G1_9BACL|nr:2'-5' RNA ligase family protein [Paenibacillus gallinarum]MBD7969245.1 2'-5' RNA ligase family protein [Paenibacillus gallinarum]